MAATRSRQDSKSSPNTKNDGKRAATDNKSSPAAKRAKKDTKSQDSGKKDEQLQQTIEETMQGIEKVEDDETVKQQIDDDEEMARKISAEQTETPAQEKTKADALKEAEAKVAQLKKEQAQEDGAKNSEQNSSTDKSNGGSQQDGKDTAKISNGVDKQTDGSNDRKEPSDDSEKKNDSNEKPKNAFNEVKADVDDRKKDSDKEQASMDKEIANNEDSIVQDSKREEAVASSILEKGVIYFFFRSRVGTEDPKSVQDIARSYIVLRPIPIGAKLGDGPLEDSGNARLLALPKKVLPKSKNDKFLMFVDKTKCSVKDLKDQFASNEYATKTVGTSTSPAVTPIAEGIYAITSTAGASHLAYHLTLPETLGEVQKDLGLNEKGSFVLSVKNPTASGPANATLDNPADYPKELMEKFRGLRWTPLEPAHLEYQATQFLIIGEGVDGGLGNAVNEEDKDKRDDSKDAPEEELEKLDEENEHRVENLKGDNAIFADLGLSAKEYPKLETSW